VNLAAKSSTYRNYDDLSSRSMNIYSIESLLIGG
jgi:hypothetical protein